MKKLNFLLLFLLGCLCFSCTQIQKPVGTINIEAVKDSVLNLTNNTARDINTRGPIAWLNYFDNDPGFFMASDGQIAFANYAAAYAFIKNTLVHQILSIKLKLSNVRIDVISPDYASIGADFHEYLTTSLNKILPYDGYVTATAHRTPNGWKYINLHWSIKKAS